MYYRNYRPSPYQQHQVAMPIMRPRNLRQEWNLLEDSLEEYACQSDFLHSIYQQLKENGTLTDKQIYGAARAIRTAHGNRGLMKYNMENTRFFDLEETYFNRIRDIGRDKGKIILPVKLAHIVDKGKYKMYFLEVQDNSEKKKVGFVTSGKNFIKFVDKLHNKLNIKEHDKFYVSVAIQSPNTFRVGKKIEFCTSKLMYVTVSDETEYFLQQLGI